MKKLTFFIVCIMTIGLLAGCGETTTPNTSTVTPDSGMQSPDTSPDSGTQPEPTPDINDENDKELFVPRIDIRREIDMQAESAVGIGSVGVDFRYVNNTDYVIRYVYFQYTDTRRDETRPPEVINDWFGVTIRDVVSPGETSMPVAISRFANIGGNRYPGKDLSMDDIQYLLLEYVVLEIEHDYDEEGCFIHYNVSNGRYERKTTRN
jgi:hypothetical protein